MAEEEVLVKVWLKLVLLLVAVSDDQVAPLSREYSYVAPAIYGVQVAVKDTELPEQIVVAVVALRVGTAVKSGLTNTCTALLLTVLHTPLVTCTR